MPENDVSTEDFFSAFEDAGYQSGAEETAGADQTENTEPSANAEETAQGAAEQAQGEENTGDAPGEEQAAEGAEATQQPESFTIKVNKEERTVTREEIITLAQKGADYDRVKAAWDKNKSDNEALNQRLATVQPVYDLIQEIAKDAGMEVEALLDSFQITRLRQKENLSEGEAKERLARVKAERELEKMKAAPAAEKSREQEQQERRDKDIAQFQKDFPDVNLGTLPVDELAADIQAGKTLSLAYQNYLMRQKDAEIQQLKAAAAAAEQNRRNRDASPGSTSDSGAKKTKSATDDFWAAFE